MIDVNTALGFYPFRRLPDDTPDRLAERLRKHGVTEAWASSLDGLLHRDFGGLNARLAEECRRHGDGLFRPIGVVHPGQPDWEEEVRRCAEVHGMSGIRLIPAYHQYDFSLPAVARLFDLAVERNLFVQVLWRVEDERTEHPLLQPKKLDAAPLVELVAARPRLRLLLLNAQRDIRTETAGRLIQAGDVSFDIAGLEGAGGIERWIAQHPPERLLFGTYAPVFLAESAVLKLRESEIPGPIQEKIVRGNAERLRSGSAEAKS